MQMRFLAGPPCLRMLAVGVAVAPLSACAGRVEPVAPPDPATCTAAWETIVPLQTDRDSGPYAMTWHDGALYGSATIKSKNVIFTTPDRGGTLRILASAVGFSMWVEGDQLFYAYFDKLYALPLAGGMPRLVIDGGLS